MKKARTLYYGTVLSSTQDSLTVRLSPPDSIADCYSCALSFACGGHKGSPMTVTVPRPYAPTNFDPKGARVTMRASADASMHAALILLALPLVVFVVAAIVCHLLRAHQLVSALTAIGSAAIVYLAIYLWHRQNPRLHWTVVDITPANT